MLLGLNINIKYLWCVWVRKYFVNRLFKKCTHPYCGCAIWAKIECRVKPRYLCLLYKFWWKIKFLFTVSNLLYKDVTLRGGKKMGLHWDGNFCTKTWRRRGNEPCRQWRKNKSISWKEKSKDKCPEVGAGLMCPRGSWEALVLEWKGI